jgi:hypothetical protein
MKAVNTSETSISVNQKTRCDIPEDSYFYLREISGSYGGEYEDSFLGCRAV